MAVKLFADCADLDTLIRLSGDPDISGFTTNPTMMRQAGVSRYEAFARNVIDAVSDKPVSFEVVADDLGAMEREARIIRSWGDNIYVKIPVSTTAGVSTAPIIERLSAEGHRLNVTALMTIRQAERVVEALDPGTPAIVSLFAGRIADTGRDPEPVVRACVDMVSDRPTTDILWASPREVFNIVQADRCGCHIITATEDLLAKRRLFGRDLESFSLETVKMFHDDARAAGYGLDDRPDAAGPNASIAAE